MPEPLLARLDAHDRALLLRCALRPASRVSHLGWCTVTCLGGTTASIAAACLPAIGGAAWQELARLAIGALVLSHLLVQIVKRTVGRGRPSRHRPVAAIREPDRFSFPSGHATASLAVALSYATAFPALAGPLILLALLVGYSRVRLGVHYPSDVLVGQALATLSTAGVAAWL